MGGDADCPHTFKAGGTASSTLGDYDNGLTQAAIEKKVEGYGHASYRSECGKCGAKRVDQQIGLEETPDEWCARLVAVMREARRVLRSDGVCWIEVGDTYNGGGTANNGNGGIVTGKGPRLGGPDHRSRKRSAEDELKHKDLVGAPWLLAKALRDPYYTGSIKREGDRVWLAAMVDAEGCIQIHRRKAGTPTYSTFDRIDGTTAVYTRQNDSFQMKIEISNTSRRIMDRIVELAGGNCDTKQEAGTHGRKQTIYRWTLTSDKAKAFLREIYPYLIGKKHEARLALGCPSSGQDATNAWQALKLLHAGSETTVDFPAPPSLYEAGWFLRSDCIWARRPPNPMPESVTDRPTKAHSYVFLLTKAARYFYDADAIRENWADERNGASGATWSKYEDMGARGRGDGGITNAPQTAGRNSRSVWSIPTEPTPFAHFATFPQALVERCIKSGTSEYGACAECGAPFQRVTRRSVPDDNKAPGGTQRHLTPGHAHVGGTLASVARHSVTTLGWEPSCDTCLDPSKWTSLDPVPCVVLDPFMGSATTALVARRLGRHAVGVELNIDYLAIAAKRLEQLSLLA